MTTYRVHAPLVISPDFGRQWQAWLDCHAKPSINRDAVTYDMLDCLESDAAAGQTLSYELGTRYTLSGRPELFYPSEAIAWVAAS